MISFTCGTYHGLFVDTGVPSILPKDKSFFDFRTKDGRSVPKDSSPNLVIRYVSNVDTETHMLMVSLVYLAVEGSREGFVAFGTLLYGNSFTSDEIEKGIKSAFEVAKGASSFFNGKTISGRPTPHDGTTIDLTNLPLVEGGKFYGKLVANINSSESIKELSQFLTDLASRLDHYEIVANPRHGMSPKALVDHFDYLVSQEQHLLEKRREEHRALKLKQEHEAHEEKLKREAKRESNSFWLLVFAFGVSGVALAGLVILILSKLLHDENHVLETKLNVVEIPTEAEGVSTTDNMEDGENLAAVNCTLEKLSSSDRSKNMIITDLPKEDKCIGVSESVTSLFTEETLDQIVTSKNLDFIVSNETPEINQRLLTTFGRIVDSDLGSKYVDDTNNFVLPDPSLSFAISMETVSPKLICTRDVEEKNIFDEDFPKFEYYTHFQNDYRQSLEWFAGGVLLRIGQAFVQIGDEIYHDEPDNSEVTSVGNKLRNFGKTLGEFVKSEDFILSTGDFEQRQNTCVILVTEEDEFFFYNDLQMPGERLISVSMDSFIQSHALVPEKYSDLVKERSKSTCQKIPGIFMVWKSDLGARMIMESTTGFTPYTYTNSEDFDFIMKPVKNYGSEDYKLPAMNKFDDLREYFVSDTDLSPFSSELYTRENFCFSANPGGR